MDSEWQAEREARALKDYRRRVALAIFPKLCEAQYRTIATSNDLVPDYSALACEAVEATDALLKALDLTEYILPDYVA